MECPNHGGAFDCTPFCSLCQGDQEIYSYQQIREQVLVGIYDLTNR
jgi:hypothetical protein